MVGTTHDTTSELFSRKHQSKQLLAHQNSIQTIPYINDVLFPQVCHLRIVFRIVRYCTGLGFMTSPTMGNWLGLQHQAEFLYTELVLNPT